LVLARAAEEPLDRVFDEAWKEALRLRDLLKFDFFFARKWTFSEEIRNELALLDPGWEQRATEPEAAWAILSGAPLHLAHRVLRPFLEAYKVVADRLAARDADEAVEEKEFLTECIGVAGQYRLQRRLYSPESISKELFGAALRLAANRDLLGPGGDDLGERRRAFADELGAEVRRVEKVRDLALRGVDTNEAEA
jgi:glycerol-3-phosphate O-acyltransferase